MLHGERPLTVMSLERGVVFVEPLAAGELAKGKEPQRTAIGNYVGAIATKTLIDTWRAHCDTHPEDTAEVLEVGPTMTVTTVYGDEVRRAVGGRNHHSVVARERRQRIIGRDLRRYARNYFQTPVEIGTSALCQVSAIPTEDNKTLFLLHPDRYSSDPGIEKLRIERSAVLSALRKNYHASLYATRDVGVVLATLHCPPDERLLDEVLAAPMQAAVDSHLQQYVDAPAQAGFWLARSRLRQRPYLSPAPTLAAQAAAFNAHDKGLHEPMSSSSGMPKRASAPRTVVDVHWHDRPVVPNQTTYDLILRDSPHLLAEIPPQTTAEPAIPKQPVIWQ